MATGVITGYLLTKNGFPALRVDHRHTVVVPPEHMEYALTMCDHLEANINVAVRYTQTSPGHFRLERE